MKNENTNESWEVYRMEKVKKCSMCLNNGWWPIGNLVPMGEMDSREWGNRVIQCPFCHNPKNGTKDNDRYVLLEGEKLRMEIQENEKKTI